MPDIEQLAVSAVTTMIGRCPRLLGTISANDKTPVTDGHIDLYSSVTKSKSDIVGRVILQVKGRSTPKKIDGKKQFVKFGINQDDVRFFHNHGGGLYFYVPMRPDGTDPEVFYAILNPFKIERLTGKKNSQKGSISVQFKRLPSDPHEIQKLVTLSHVQRPQTFAKGTLDSHIESADSFTIHALSAISDERPTEFSLDHDDFAIMMTTHEGLEIPIDVDIKIFPPSYVPQKLNKSVICGDISYHTPLGERTSENEILIHCSDGLKVRLIDKGSETGSKVDLTLTGSFYQQHKDATFFLALAEGARLTIGDLESESRRVTPASMDELKSVHRELTQLVEVLNYMGLDEQLTSTLPFTLDDRSNLLRLHRGLILGEEVAATGDGAGRWDFPVAGMKVILLVSAGTMAGKLAISDPFDPARRGLIRMLGPTDEGGVEEVRSATVYESLEAADYTTALNVRLDNIEMAYRALPDGPTRRSFASNTLLRMLSAVDGCVEPRRGYLIRKALSLSEWLVSISGRDTIHLINLWQTQKRNGSFGLEERRELAVVRRNRLFGEADTLAIEACLAILLDDDTELDLVLADMREENRALLKSWPIWNLVTNGVRN